MSEHGSTPGLDPESPPTVPTDREIDPGDSAVGHGADGLTQERLEQKAQGGP